MNNPHSCIIDLEVQNKPWYGSLASPFNPENYIVAPAFAMDAGPVQHWYFHSKEEADASDWFKLPDSVQILVAHNATFELHWLLHRHREELMKFLKRGGKIFCTQFAEYILSMQTEMYPSLDETAPKYGGSHKVDAVKLLWEQGFTTAEIEQTLLIEYLAGPEGDIENTRKCYFSQYAKLEGHGMLDMFWLRMDSLLHKAFCTFFGMHVDVPTADADQAVLQENVDALRAALAAELPVLPSTFEFNWGSDYHTSALLFGGPIKYKEKVQYDPPKFEKIEVYQTLDGQYVEVDIAQSQIAMYSEYVTYKSGKNKGEIKVFTVDSVIPKLKWADAVYQFPGLVDFAELPVHVAEAFTDKRGSFRGKRYLCDIVEDDNGKVISGTPVYSTSGDAMKSIIPHTECPVPKLLEELAGDEKELSTFYIGMREFLTPESIIHHQLNMCSTATARLSASKPNMQQIKRDGNVKRMFSSRFPEGQIIECDYTALEVVHLAVLSGDKALLDALIAGTDMHTLRLSKSIGEAYEDLLGILDDKTHSRYSEIKQARQNIKSPSFAYQYGATAEGIAFATGCTVEYAQNFIDTENLLFPESSQYRHYVASEVQQSSEHPSMFCREQSDDGIWRVYRRGYFIAPSTTRYQFRQREQWKLLPGDKRKSKVLDFKITEMANYPVQGEASFVMQVADGLIIRWLISQDFYGDKVLPINSVHDANYLDTAKEYTSVAGLHTKALMEYAPKYIASIFPEYAKLDIQDTPYPAVPEAGLNMKEKSHL